MLVFLLRTRGCVVPVAVLQGLQQNLTTPESNWHSLLAMSSKSILDDPTASASMLDGSSKLRLAYAQHRTATVCDSAVSSALAALNGARSLLLVREVMMALCVTVWWMLHRPAVPGLVEDSSHHPSSSPSTTAADGTQFRYTAILRLVSVCCSSQ